MWSPRYKYIYSAEQYVKATNMISTILQVVCLVRQKNVLLCVKRCAQHNFPGLSFNYVLLTIPVGGTPNFSGRQHQTQCKNRCNRAVEGQL